MSDGNSPENGRHRPALSGHLFLPEWNILRQTGVITNFQANTDSPAQPLLDFVSIDEVGRGCVAGPVVVAACRWTAHVRSTRAKCINESFNGPPIPHQHADESFFESFVKDSKKLSAKQRPAIAATLCRWADVSFPKSGRATAPMLHLPLKSLCYRNVPEHAQAADEMQQISVSLESIALGSASILEIEKKNIWGATQIAMARALSSLHTTDNSGTLPAAILFDGKLVARVPAPWKNVCFVNVVSGDSLLRSIGAASIVAKVYRDNQITKLDETFPDYGFAKHKGYGTKNHFAAILQHGLTKHHRPSFLRNILPSGT